MSDGDVIYQNGDSGAEAQAPNNGGVWFGNTASGPCWRKWIAIDAATGAVDGVYMNCQGASWVNFHVALTTSANVRLWGEDTADGAVPTATDENNQIGSALTADGAVTVTEPYEFMKAEATAATGALTVLATAHYPNGRP